MSGSLSKRLRLFDALPGENSGRHRAQISAQHISKESPAFSELFSVGMATERAAPDVNDKPPNARHEDPKERKVSRYPDDRFLPGNSFRSETTTLSRLEALERSLKLMKGREEVLRNENRELHKQLKEQTLQLNNLRSGHQELQGNLNLVQARESLISQEFTRVRVEIAEPKHPPSTIKHVRIMLYWHFSD
jgi:hypothetical protein